MLEFRMGISLSLETPEDRYLPISGERRLPGPRTAWHRKGCGKLRSGKGAANYVAINVYVQVGTIP